MSERNRLLAIIGLIFVVLLVIVGIVVRLLLRPAQPIVTSEPEFQGPPAASLDSAPATAPTAPARDVNPLFGLQFPDFPTDGPVKTGSTQMAELFAERYGSYSNQSDYGNLRDLLPLMTAKLRSETEAKLEAASGTPTEYVGVTSRKLSSKLTSGDESSDRVVIEVSVQQTKTVGTGAPEVSYKTYVVRLVKVGDDWKVDAISER